MLFLRKNHLNARKPFKWSFIWLPTAFKGIRQQNKPVDRSGFPAMGEPYSETRGNERTWRERAFEESSCLEAFVLSSQSWTVAAVAFNFIAVRLTYLYRIVGLLQQHAVNRNNVVVYFLDFLANCHSDTVLPVLTATWLSVWWALRAWKNKPCTIR